MITITANGYKPLTFKVSIKDNKLTVSSDSTPGDDQQLHVRLAGTFESALVNQKGYDAISGATITSKAVTNAVNGAMYYVHHYTEAGEQAL